MKPLLFFSFDSNILAHGWILEINRSKKQKTGVSQADERQFRQVVFETHQTSGLTVKQFCKNEGLAEWSFYHWRRKLHQSTDSKPSKASTENLQVKESTPTVRRFQQIAQLSSIDIMHQDPLSGHVFVFGNRREDKLQLLYWDRDGFAIWYKRLEKGTFFLPEGSDLSGIIDYRQLSMILEGMDLSSVHLQRRFHLKNL